VTGLPALQLAAFVGAVLFAQVSSASIQRLKVEGTWDGQQIHVERVKLRNPGKDASRIRISGTVRHYSYANRRIKIGPVALNWTADQDTVFSTIGLGDALQVDAQQNPHSAFTVLNWERTTMDHAESIELIGTVTGSRDNGETTELFLAEIPTITPRRLYQNGRMRIRRLDDKRPDEQWVIMLGKVRTTIGGELGFKSKFRDDRDLDAETDARQATAEEQLQLEAFFEIGDDISIFAESKGEYSQDYDVASKSNDRSFALSRGQFWIYLDQFMGLPVGVQVGRQNFAENREWWWDTDLDALRVYVHRNSFDIELAVAEELAPHTLNEDFAGDKDIFRLLGRATLRLAADISLDLFYLHQNDHSSPFRLGEVLSPGREDSADLSLTWVGARFYGDFAPFDLLDTEYWLDLARVEGTETLYDFADTTGNEIFVEDIIERERSGWALDAGATFVFSDIRMGAINEPTLSVGYAYGSGDDSSNGTFRQTGLNDNNAKFNGVDRFRYYGELARPELSNMSITTASLGFRVGSDSSVELAYHDYRQVVSSTENTLRIDADSNGRSNHLGSEFDLVVGIEQWEHLEIELVGGYFLPGDAFDSSDSSWLLAAKLNYNF